MIDRRTVSGLSPDVNGYCYEDAAHFDRSMTLVARRLRRWKDWRITLTPIAGALLIVAASMAMAIAVDDRFGILVFTTIPAWAAWAAARRHRLHAMIVARRLCLQCGYELGHTPVDDEGWGVCSECGRAFNLAEYRRPPRGYVRPPSMPRLKRAWE